MSTPTFIVIRLLPGWTLAADGQSVTGAAGTVALQLPASMQLTQAVQLPPPPFGPPTQAERELGRYLHLHLQDSSTYASALAMALSWSFVDRAGPVP
jgi:hypothetical protein